MILDMQTSTTPLTIYTIGHSNVPAEKIVTLLKNYHVEVVVDIRSSPFSRFSPQFNRNRFTQILSEVGVEYEFAGDLLGGRPKDPSSYKDGSLPKGKVDFLHVVDYPAMIKKEPFKQGISHLVDIASQKTVAIMCSEADPAICHRHHLVGRYLTRQGYRVLHILKDGSLAEDGSFPNLQDDLPES